MFLRGSLAWVLGPRRPHPSRKLFAEPRLAELGIVLVGGHTEVTKAVNQPVIVGQMFGLAEDRRFVKDRRGKSQAHHRAGRPARSEGAAVLAC